MERPLLIGGIVGPVQFTLVYLLRRRERLGISYLMVGDELMRVQPVRGELHQR